MGYEVYMDGNADTEGNYSLVALRCKSQTDNYNCESKLQIAYLQGVYVTNILRTAFVCFWDIHV